ncbi:MULTISPECIES: hypothetical protein [Legionella]|uniref:Iron-containing redox enzyme family protein n=1 Tax=Legionella septentrionalis TaxID=2498109 RepID=A0A3S0V4F1_9GAMM|nr:MULTISPECIES: hypothetical protein [Legionella]MCP0913696.1 hypothetical protein [Legionella sp. 27cVA30]RUQ80999.1 hypothetical protein EKM59_10960 [Legionella septentrionalis]RUQ97492.1 hypothetical protein ELY11_06475 [Legionella septentrionalis]RUR09788.1 hypothetical protein ELY14_07625 [Legionella septentrionalis]RUR15920.1 hypothetical protein ELY10_04540 [Legionella septentrionalis]
MKTIQSYLESKQQEFMEHPFFKTLGQLNSLEEIGYFVPELTFWAMTFQDILRLNEERVTDPYLKKVARHHRLEDSGHEKWFLQDKKYMASMSKDKSCNKDNVAWLYSKESQITRDAAYAILGELYKIDDEILNIVLLLTLESSGHVFFEKVAKQVQKTGEDKNLKYFSSSHLEVEMAHALFEDEMEKKLFARSLPINLRRKALKLIDRCYEAFNRMFDGLIIACNNRLALAQQRKQQHAANAVEYTEDQAM